MNLLFLQGEKHKSPTNRRKIGSSPVKNTLKIAIFGVNVITFESDKNQSNDKKASVDEPTFSAGRKASDKADGNFKLNDIAAVISWK